MHISTQNLLKPVLMLSPRFVPAAKYYIGGAMVTKLNITSVTVITEAIEVSKPPA